MNNQVANAICIACGFVYNFKHIEKIQKKYKKSPNLYPNWLPINLVCQFHTRVNEFKCSSPLWIKKLIRISVKPNAHMKA